MLNFFGVDGNDIVLACSFEKVIVSVRIGRNKSVEKRQEENVDVITYPVSNRDKLQGK